MYKNVRTGFEKVSRSMLEGANEWIILWKMYVPDSRNGIVSGMILCFARAMGEYGATSMLAGNIPGKTGTISQQIAMVIHSGDYLKAGIWSVFVMVLAFTIVFLLNLFF